jgi:hypothetical protein
MEEAAGLPGLEWAAFSLIETYFPGNSQLWTLKNDHFVLR